MKKKIVAGLVTLLSVATLAACSSNASEGDKLVTMKGDYITVSDFYNQVKSSSAAKQGMLTLILDKVLKEQYGDKVSDKKIDDTYNKEMEAYGDSYQQVLAMNGMTEESYKQQIRVSLYLDYAIEQLAKKDLTDDKYKELYDAYTPEMTLQVIQLTDQDTANSVLSEVKAEGADFGAIAGDKSASDTVDYKVDSESTDLPSDVIQAAAKLDNGGVSDVIAVQNPQTTVTTYYIVKVTAKSEKDSDWKTYKDRLTEAYVAKQKSDSNMQRKVISEALSKANVKIKDEAFSSVLSEFATTDETSTETTTAADSTTASESTTEATTAAQ